MSFIRDQHPNIDVANLNFNFRWKHKILVFFKLFLLEKKILFFGTPVKPVCQCIISIISLHPELLNSGLCNAEQKFKVKDDTQTNDTTSRNVKTPEKSPDLDNLDEFDSKKQITILPSEYNFCLPSIKLKRPCLQQFHHQNI